MKRRCGWVPKAQETASRTVWANKNVAIDTCPTSYVTAQSLAWIEEFFVRRKLGQKMTDTMGSKDVDAFVILQEQLGEQVASGE